MFCFVSLPVPPNNKEMLKTIGLDREFNSPRKQLSLVGLKQEGHFKNIRFRLWELNSPRKQFSLVGLSNMKEIQKTIGLDSGN